MFPDAPSNGTVNSDKGDSKPVLTISNATLERTSTFVKNRWEINETDINESDTDENSKTALSESLLSTVAMVN
ncbi:MAG: hypothetical protein ACI4NO_08185 [Oxalobacter sp.]